MNISLIFCLFRSLLLTYGEWTIARTRFQSRQPGLDPGRHHTTRVPVAGMTVVFCTSSCMQIQEDVQNTTVIPLFEHV